MAFLLSPNCFTRWLLSLLLALSVPVQGFAASTMLLCGAMSQAGHHGEAVANAKPVGHDMAHGHHPVEVAAYDVMSDHSAHQAQPDPSAGGDNQHGKCSSCASCSMGTALVSALLSDIPGSPGSAMIPFTPDSFDDHTPTGLDPPPRS